MKNKFNKKDLAAYKKLIIERKNEILDSLNRIEADALKKSPKDASGDISGYAFHMADVATDNYDREFSLGLASNDRQFLYELDETLKRIQDGVFGICEGCKSVLTKARLKALPYARFCLACQRKKEEE